MRRYLLPGALYLVALAASVALNRNPLFWLPLSGVCAASLWWVVVAARAKPPLAPHLAAVLAPALLPIYLIWLSAKAMAYSDAAAIGIIALAPFIVLLLALPAAGFLVLLVRLLQQPPKGD